MTIRQRLQKIEDRVNALALRERALLLLAALAVVFFLVDTFMLRPLDQRREDSRRLLDQTGDRVAQLSSSVEQLASRQRNDPNAALIAERNSLQQRMQAISSELAQLDTGLLGPGEMLGLLHQLLADRTDLKLVSLDKIPAEPLDPESTVGSIFVHRFSIVFESDFSGLLGYVRLIENMPRGLYWESLKLSVPEWPTNRAEVVLYMLALDEDWLGV
ncbi:MAG: hypothetical protein WD397_16790 [Wenzhouxiangellaceae bacterium]